jgi:molecular chaperone GrpE
MREEIERDDERQDERQDERPEDERPEDELEATAVGVEPSAEIEELREEVDRLNDRHLRLAAEFDNYRKRNERDRHRLVARLQADLVASLLDVVDDLERVAQSGTGTTPDAVMDGVRLVEKKFRTVLDAAGLEAIDADGELFDPSVMEAMATVPTDDPAEDDLVADVFQRGYRFGEILVRPARVRVLKYESPAERSE